MFPDGSRKYYHREVSYKDPFRIRRLDAMRMARTLTRIERFLERSPIRPETFGQYAALVAQAVKARGVIVRQDLEHASDYSEMQHERFANESASTSTRRRAS